MATVIEKMKTLQEIRNHVKSANGPFKGVPHIGFCIDEGEEHQGLAVRALLPTEAGPQAESRYDCQHRKRVEIVLSKSCF